MTTWRNASAPLASFLTSVDHSVADAAQVLYNKARSKTRRGSGHELPPEIEGNVTAMVAASLMLAQIDASGASEVDVTTYQKQSSMKPAHFKILLNTLRYVLGIQGASSPTKTGSARKRKASAIEDGDADGPITPTKASSSRSRATPAVSASKATSTPRTTPRSSRVAALSNPSISASKRARVEENMAEDTIAGEQSTEGLRTPSRRSARVTARSSKDSDGEDEPALQVTTKQLRPARASKTDSAMKTPTKSAGKTGTPKKSKTASTAAFDSVMAAPSPSPSPTKPKGKATPANGKGADTPVAKAISAFERAVEEEGHDGTIPYEPYLDDMLLRWRTPGWKEVLKETERWRVAMLERYDIPDEVY